MSNMTFDENIRALVAREMSEGRGNPERHADAIETLLRSAGMAIAVACGGNSKLIDTMLIGSESYLTESAADYSRIAEALHNIHRRNP